LCTDSKAKTLKLQIAFAVEVLVLATQKPSAPSL
jgi:hypothetical protein